MYAIFEDLIVKENILFKKDIKNENRLQIFVPVNLRNKIMNHFHDTFVGCHLAQEKTVEKIKCKFFWPYLKRDVLEYIKNCVVCAETKRPHQNFIAPLEPIKTGNPFQRINVDFCGPLPETKTGNKYLLVIIDSFTNWVIAVPMKTMEAKATAEALVKNWIVHYGTLSNHLIFN